jgi:signal transduction histidine kinase
MNDEMKTQDEVSSELEKLREKFTRLDTQLRVTEKSLKDCQQQLQQAQKMETLGTLVAGVAHEINNPINLIMYNLPLIHKVWVDLMPVLIEQRQKDPDQKYGGFTYDFLQDNFLQLISDMDMAANRVVKIVADLKNFSRQSNVAEKKPLQVNTAVKNAMRLAQTTLRKSGVEVKLSLTENLPQMEGNLQSIEQIILNILINAVHAIDHDSGYIHLSTGFQIKDGRIYVRIEDNGSGINPEIADKIFLPFVTDKQADGGTGLGLSVTYSLIKAHEGEIIFDSRKDAGTTFTVYLPTFLQRQASRILVVDDDKEIRQMLIEALTIDRRYLVEEAANGIEASIKLGTYRPDLLILDIFMPEMDGLEVCRIIKTERELANMKVIITTGYPDHVKLDEVTRLGFTNIFYKPFDLWEFVKAVQTILP